MKPFSIFILSLFFISELASQAISPYGLRRQASTSTVDNFVEVDPLSVHKTGIDTITGEKIFKFNNSKTTIDGWNFIMEDPIDWPGRFVSLNLEEAFIFVQSGTGSFSFSPGSFYCNRSDFNSNVFSNSGYELHIERGTSGYVPTDNDVLRKDEIVSLVSDIDTFYGRKFFVQPGEDKTTINGGNISCTSTSLPGVDCTFGPTDGFLTYSDLFASQLNPYGELFLERASPFAKLFAGPNFLIINRGTEPYTKSDNDVLTKGEIQNMTKQNTIIYTSNGTYTPATGVKEIIVEMVGGGGGSGTSPITNGTTQLSSACGGGGGGGYIKVKYTAAQLTGSISIQIGNGGAAGTNTSVPTDGNNGGSTIFGTLCTCTGGTRGRSVTQDTIVQTFINSGGTCTNTVGQEIVKVQGGHGETSFANGNVFYGTAGNGGSTPLGNGGIASLQIINFKKQMIGFSFNTPQGYGSGGAGSFSVVKPGTAGGGVQGIAGNQGIIIITELF